MAGFANPFIACVECARRVKLRKGRINLPCGHDADYISTCVSWSPVDGCTCKRPCGLPRL